MHIVKNKLKSFVTNKLNISNSHKDNKGRITIINNNNNNFKIETLKNGTQNISKRINLFHNILYHTQLDL